MERARGKLAPRARSEYGRVLFLLASGAIHLFRRLRESAARQRLLRGRTLLARLSGLYGRRGGRGRTRGKGGLSATRGQACFEIGLFGTERTHGRCIPDTNPEQMNGQRAP